MTPNLSKQQIENLHRKKKKVIYTGTFLVLSYLFILFFFGEVNIPHYLSMRKTYFQMKNDIEHLKEENAHLRKHAGALKSDPAQIERLAREQLDLAKKGEIIYEFPKPDTAQSFPPAK